MNDAAIEDDNAENRTGFNVTIFELRTDIIRTKKTSLSRTIPVPNKKIASVAKRLMRTVKKYMFLLTMKH